MPVHRVLLSAHDPGAATGIVTLMRAIDRDRRFTANAVASGPAVDIFEAAGIAFDAVDCPRIERTDAPAYSRLCMLADGWLDTYAPDATVGGLSGPDAGLDEALAFRAKGRIPTFLVQDFWGDVNRVLPDTADHFLVCDSLAARLTQARVPGAETTIFGSLRHAELPVCRRDEARAQLGAAEGTRLYILFGQPLWHAPGYAGTLQTLAPALAQQTGSNAQVRYRPHPRETADERARTQAILEAEGLRVLSANDHPLETVLAACDVALSAFSTIANDLAFLHRLAPDPLAVPVYLFWNPELTEYYRGYTGLDDLPVVELGLGEAIRDPSGVGNRLAEAADAERRAEIWRNARALPDPSNAPDAVLEAIETKLNGELT